MLIALRNFLFFISVLLWIGCGQKPTPTLQIVLAPDTFLQNTSAQDIVFFATNSGSPVLDTDNNGFPDVFAFPATCCQGINCSTTAPPALCGYDLSVPATISIGTLPLGYSYDVQAWVRNSAGTEIFLGNSSLKNDGSQPTLSITLSPYP